MSFKGKSCFPKLFYKKINEFLEDSGQVKY